MLSPGIGDDTACICGINLPPNGSALSLSLLDLSEAIFTTQSAMGGNSTAKVAAERITHHLITKEPCYDTGILRCTTLSVQLNVDNLSFLLRNPVATSSTTSAESSQTKIDFP